MATTKNIQSLERAFSILELFTSVRENELSLKEISEKTRLNKSTTFGLVNTLYQLGYLHQNDTNQKYSLGLKILSLSHSVRTQNVLTNIIHPYLRKISDQFRETAHCAIQVNKKLTYIDKVEARGSATINTDIGGENYLHCTGVGKCLLAYLPEEKQETVLLSALPAMTKNTITDPALLRKELQKVREQGFAVDHEEISIGLSCYAVPILATENEAPCAISVSGITGRIQIAYENGLLSALKDLSRAISLDAYGFESTLP